jgi:hypothetical protein
MSCGCAERRERMAKWAERIKDRNRRILKQITLITNARKRIHDRCDQLGRDAREPAK